MVSPAKPMPASGSMRAIAVRRWSVVVWSMSMVASDVVVWWPTS
jgi:hypothetical protein